MLSLLFSLTLLSIPPVTAQNNVTSLTGTWSSKSNAVFTGPASFRLPFIIHFLTESSEGGKQSFYNPVREELKEPILTGTSYSFTDDGYYEEAVYLAVANRERPGHDADSDLSLLLYPLGG